MAVTPKANLKTSSSAFGWSSFFHHPPSRGKKRTNFRIFVVVLCLVFLVGVCLKTTSNSSGKKTITFRVRIRRKLGGFLSETTISKTKKNVLDEVKHFAQFHQHTTFQEEEEENHGNERRREEEGEHEREAVIAHDLPQSTVDAHLDETEEENRSSGSETTTSARGFSSRTEFGSACTTLRTREGGTR